MAIKIPPPLLFMFLIFILSCKTEKPLTSVAGYYNNETECLETRYDGSLTLMAWGKGKNEHEAIAQAKKNAIRDIIFKGITKGKQNCNIKPLVMDVQAKEKYENYWNSFFSNNGPYIQFATLQKGPTNKKFNAGDEVTYGVMLRVYRQNLKNRLIRDNILK